MGTRNAVWAWAAMLVVITCGSGRAESGPVPPTPTQIRPILIGSEAPGPVLKNASGDDVDLAAMLEQRSTVLVFYRAHW